MAEPVDLSDIKGHLALEADDTSEDTYLSSMIVAARRACELRTRRSIVGEQRELVLPCFPGADPINLIWAANSSLAIQPAGSRDVQLAGGTVTAVEVRYYDEDGTDVLLDSAQYFAALNLKPAALRPMASWPSAQDRPDAVRITFTISPLDGAELEMVKHAMRLIVGHWYMNREAVATNAKGSPIELPMSVGWLLNPITKFASD